MVLWTVVWHAFHEFTTSSNGDGDGYIVMEFSERKLIDPLDASAIERVAKVLDYFSTLRGSVPGPPSRGPCRGLLFPDTLDLVFDTLDEMEKWWNSRILPHEPKLTFQGFELVFCHLDIAPRNILWLEDGSICIVGWNSAGYYPKLFEFCSQWIIEGWEFQLSTFERNEPSLRSRDGPANPHASRLDPCFTLGGTSKDMRCKYRATKLIVLEADLLSAVVTRPTHGPAHRNGIRMPPVLCSPKCHHIHHGGSRKWSVILNVSVRRRRSPLLLPLQTHFPKLTRMVVLNGTSRAFCRRSLAHS